MKQKNRNQSGFGTMGIVLVLVIVAVIGTVGWVVLHGKSGKSPTITSSETGVTDDNLYLQAYDNCHDKAQAGNKDASMNKTTGTCTYKGVEYTVPKLNN